jgi:mRNA-degrading endonuclease YafQ of YafQ-DinJ toxin-antitoxin module
MMKFKLIFPASYLQRAHKFLKRHPELRKQYQKTLELLELNPQHPSLRLHKLEGKLSGLSSVSINVSYRIVIEMIISDHEIMLINVGSHDQVY